MGNVDVNYATGSFCSSYSIPPPTAGGLWCLKGVREGTLWTGKSQARNPTHKRKAEKPLAPATVNRQLEEGPSYNFLVVVVAVLLADSR